MEAAVVLQNSLKFLVPEAFLIAFGTLMLLVSPFLRSKLPWGIISIAGVLGAYSLLWQVPRDIFQLNSLYLQPVLQDQLSTFVRHFAIGMGFFFILLFWAANHEKYSPEIFAMIIFQVTGCSIVSCSNDLIVLFLGLELISIPSYILLFLGGNSKASREATLKYFYLSVLFAGMLLFGFSYMFGLTGSTNISLIQDTFLANKNPVPMVVIPVIAIVAGLGFKVSLVPFHFYAPDVYQGTSFRAASMLATVPKVAGFVALLRLFGFALVGQQSGSLGDSISLLFWILAAITMCLGSTMALLQRNLGRILAFSSITHSGYLMMALSVAPKLAPDHGVDLVGGVLFYLFAYFFATYGAFAILEALQNPERKIVDWDDLAGTSVTNPWLAAILVLFLFSLTGIPLTGGFLAKFLMIFSAASVPFNSENNISVETHNVYLLLAVVAVVNAAIGAWFYLKIVSGLYFKPSVWPQERKLALRPIFLAIGLAAIATIILGVYPKAIFKSKLFRGSSDSVIVGSLK